MDADAYARWVLETPRPDPVVQPRESYVIAATPRCGSWLLCGLLESAGVAGHPHEWFWRDTRESLMRSWAAADEAEYLELVLAAGTTPNGVFGAKTMWGSLPEPVPFPRPRFVWMRRRDLVAQAVSFARAVQTGHWHHWDAPPASTPDFRFEEVDALLRELEQLEGQWAAWFEREGVEPFEVTYEDLVAEPQAETVRALAFLGLDLGARGEVRPLTERQSDRINEDWAARYRVEVTQRPA
jgi:LPS sulfotransferase NodH